MIYFEVEKETYLIVDDSPIGISAILAQSIKDEPQKVTAYASRAITPVERQYSPTEKEALCIVWGRTERKRCAPAHYESRKAKDGRQQLMPSKV